MKQELGKIHQILTSFLGESKAEFDPSVMQYQFPCPRCVENYGPEEARKNNLECNLKSQVFQCWKCGSEGGDMHGSVSKLIRLYGNDRDLAEYKSILRTIREGDLYVLRKDGDDTVNTSSLDEDCMKLPSTFKYFKEGEKCNYYALKYLNDRGIGWDVINSHRIGYTTKEESEWKKSWRIIVPSFDQFGEMSYWVGRDYLNSDKSKYRMKYENPKAEKREFIFNEGRVQWDADITLVEGVFDHIVVPNSIPLLGKALSKEYKLYWSIMDKANANINIFLDGDAFESVKKIYKLLNHGRFYGKIRYIPVGKDEDPSSVYQAGGRKAIMDHLRNAKVINEVYLI